jgi:hypothetical protein
MVVKPCTQCRRHVRIDESRCPFCGAVAEVIPTPDDPPRMSRARAFAVTSTLATFAATTWACGAYGGPPPRVADDVMQDEVGFDVELSMPLPDHLSAVAAKAEKEGCTVTRQPEDLHVTCGDAKLRITGYKHTGYIGCEKMSRRDCRAHYARIAP